jgi:hypothetical protein
MITLDFFLLKASISVIHICDDFKPFKALYSGVFRLICCYVRLFIIFILHLGASKLQREEWWIIKYLLH